MPSPAGVAITDEMNANLSTARPAQGAVTTEPRPDSIFRQHARRKWPSRYRRQGRMPRVSLSNLITGSTRPIVQGGFLFTYRTLSSTWIDNALRHGPDPKQTTPSVHLWMADRRDDCASRSRTTAPYSPPPAPPDFPSRLPFRSDRRQPRDRAGLYPEYRPPDRSTAPPRQPLGHGSRFILTFTPGQKHRSRKIHLSPRFYSCFIVAIMFAALFWTGNLYIADRRAFVNEELPNLDEAIFKNNKNFLNGGRHQLFLQ